MVAVDMNPQSNSPTTPPPHSAILTEIEAAKFLNMKIPTLRAWRLKRRGPRFLKFGRAVRYRLSDLEQFVAESAISPRQTSIH